MAGHLENYKPSSPHNQLEICQSNIIVKIRGATFFCFFCLGRERFQEKKIYKKQKIQKSIKNLNKRVFCFFSCLFLFFFLFFSGKKNKTNILKNVLKKTLTPLQINKTSNKLDRTIQYIKADLLTFHIHRANVRRMRVQGVADCIR